MGVEFFITSLIVILIPGTGVVYTVAAGLMHGRTASVFAAIGCTLGILPHLTATVFGIVAILHASATMFQFVKYCGVAYLIYLAWQTLNDAGPLQIGARDESKRGPLATIVTGFLINILNPKLSIFFLAFLPQFIDPAKSANIFADTLLLGATFMAMTFAVFVVYGFSAAYVRVRFFRNPRLMKWMRRTVAATFAGCGLRLAFADR